MCIALLLAALLPVGCARKKVTVSGKVVRSGQPIAVSKTGIVRVTLVPIVDAGSHFTTYPSKTKPDGSFEISNVPRGKYRIAVEVLDPTPRHDALGGVFSPRSSKIERDIDGKAPLQVDITQPTG
jgi:hypothetical protein